MTASSQATPAALPHADLDAAVAALFCRFGDPKMETERLGLLQFMLTCSRGLARVLEDFTKEAVVHYRGVHCAADMNARVAELSHALAQWTWAVDDTAAMYRRCHEACEPDADSRSSGGTGTRSA